MRKPAVLRLITIAAASAIGLGLGEVVARKTYGEGFNILVDPYEDHSYRPYLEYEQVWGQMKYRFYTNSLGWKDSLPDRKVEKRSPYKRIVFLGDSFTEGLGYPQEKTLSAFAERELNVGSRRLEVLNGGRASYSPLLEYQRLKKFLAAGYRADVVVLLHDVSDVQDEISYSARYEFSETGEPLRFRGWNYQPSVRALYNHSALVRSIRRLPQSLRRSVGPARAEASLSDRELRPELRLDAAPISAKDLGELAPWEFGLLRPNWIAHPPSLAGWAEEGLRSSFANLERIQGLTRAHGMRLVLVIYPNPPMLYTRDDPSYYAVLKQTFPRWFADREILYGVRPAPRITEYQRRMHAFCRRREIPILDLIPELQDQREWHRLFIPGDVHFNESGNRLVGIRIAAVLRRSLG